MFRTGAFFQLFAKTVVTAQGARFHDVGGNGDVFPGQLHALIQGAHCMADFQAHVPEKRDKAFQAVPEALIRGFGHQHQDIHIGAGVQLGPAIAAHRDQRQVITVGQPEQGPGGDHHLVHQFCPGADQLGNVCVFKGLIQALLALFQVLAGILARLGAFLEGLKQMFLGQGGGESHTDPVMALRACQLHDKPGMSPVAEPCQ